MYEHFKSILANWFANLDDSRVRSLAGLIEFNAAHPDIELPAAHCPDQADLLAVLSETTPAATVADHLAQLRRLGGPEGIDLVLDHYGIDVLVAPGDSALCELAAAAGYPLATAPLGALRSNGRPFGVAVTARAHEEGRLLHFLTAWESVFHPTTSSTSSSSSSPSSSHSGHSHHSAATTCSLSPSSSPPSSSSRPVPLPLDSVPFPKPDELLPPDGPVIKVILKEWDTRDFRQSSDALTGWLNARWRKSGYSLGMETVYEILKANGRKAYRGLGDEAGGAFRRRGRAGEGEGEGEGVERRGQQHERWGSASGGSVGDMGDWGRLGDWDERREDGGEVKPLFGGPG
ncbi:hypothetical protein SLS55_002096 [Diplodia seriata]|uniref:Uncharacterized protein n=1 Tax=Diplodia seriata TaxID=420778 RepID=A0ABR3CR83_9PEZI